MEEHEGHAQIQPLDWVLFCERETPGKGDRGRGGPGNQPPFWYAQCALETATYFLLKEMYL